MSCRLVVLALVCQAAASSAIVAPTPSPPPPTTSLAALATLATGNGTAISRRVAPFNASLLPEEPWFPYRPLLMECFPRLSWPCFQTKMLLYVDQLNRARRVRILGDLITLEKTRPDRTPPLTEELLSARHIRDPASLLSLLELVTDRFIDTHVIRLDLPAWDGARLVSDPVEIGFVVDDESDDSVDTGDREGRGKKGGGKKKKMKGGKKMMKMMMGAGKKMVEMMGKLMMGKMMLMVPIAMKKGMIGGMAGLMSMGMMKFMLLQKVLSLLKSKCGGGGGGGGGGCGGGGGGGGDDCCGGGGGGGGDCCGGGGGGGGGGYGRIEWARTDAYNRVGYPSYPTVAAPAVAGYYQQPHPQPPYAYDYWRQQPKEDKTWTLWR